MSRPANDLQALLPHQPPMRMLGHLLALDADRIHCNAIIAADNPLLRDGRFPAIGGLELLAQAAGALFGSRSAEKAAQPGAIVRVKRFSLQPISVAVGTELHIHASFRGASADAALFDGQVLLAEQCLFSGSLMIAILPPELNGAPT